MNILISVIFILLSCSLWKVHSEIYDRLIAKPVDNKRLNEIETSHNFGKCLIDVKTCTPHEGSRVDGTCNNFKHPSRCSAFGPYMRMLPPNYDSEKKKALPAARKIREMILQSGRGEDETFSSAAAILMKFIQKDLSELSSYDFIKTKTDCCNLGEITNSSCSPLQVDSDDLYLKGTGISCLNFTRPETFQDFGCTDKTMNAEQINRQTPVLDLSVLYGVNDEALENIRTKENGHLKMEIRDNRTMPLFSKNCIGNDTNMTNCYSFGSVEAGNSDPRTTSLTILFMREHNRLATLLTKLNPCWKDDRIFKVARQINIGILSNIFFYELMPLLMGYKNMIHNGLISERATHVTAYDDEALSLLYSEFDVALRYFNSWTDGRIKKYDDENRYVGEFSVSDTLFKPNILEAKKISEEINRGNFRQPAARFHKNVDPEISTFYFREYQKSFDLLASDIQTAREFGVQNYNKYRNLCGMNNATKFEDFADVMDIEAIDVLKSLYKTIDEVELLPALIVENLIPGGHIGSTMFCIMVKQMQLMRFADRFWFERGDQFHSLQLSQIIQIRKTSMARLACDNAEGIKSIQPEALLNISPRNSQIPCSHIQDFDLSKWKDISCENPNNLIKEQIPLNIFENIQI